MDKKQKLIELWQLCFDDTEAFIQLYFDRVYKEENALTIESNGALVSALQIIPYTMNFCGSELNVAYISGACTHPAYRGKGYMGELLEEAFRVMRRQGFDLTALIPANPSLFEYYRRYGYTEIFDYTIVEETVPATPLPDQGIILSTIDQQSIDTAFAYFDRKLKERPSCILHTKEDFITTLMEFHQDEGATVLATNKDGLPVGMAFLYPSIDHVYLKEFLYDSEKIRIILSQKILSHYQMNKIQYIAPPQAPETHRLGMAMFLNRERASRLWLAKNPLLPVTPEELQMMDTQTLTRHLLNGTYMSLMHD